MRELVRVSKALADENRVRMLKLLSEKDICVCEMVEMNSEIRELAFAKAPTSELRKAARASGMRPLMDDGKIKIFKGITTLEEVARTAQTEEVITG